uniref:Diaminopimelate decarboxylase n=1 Tax=Caligus clemensi TaxID=344056 RepID=C1C309_CALCM|nr:Diaminopimelate decarboxylase [Caligus clemensi]
MDAIYQVFLGKKNILNDSCPSIDIFDLDYFNSRITSLLKAFPSDGQNLQHTFAVKANPLRGVLLAAKARGLGAECASISEVLLSLSLGFEPCKVIFDSPCKTREDIRIALNSGVVMNLDNEREMGLVHEILQEGNVKDRPLVGLRINPVVGGGDFDILSTATKASKFGLPLCENTKERILSLFEECGWLNGVHIHVGSQGVPLKKFVDGAKKLMEFVHKIESCRGGRLLETVDIGGGLSTSYILEDVEPKEFTFALYKEELSKAVPELFDGRRRVITEFGRSLALKAGKTLTRVEHIKEWIPEIRPIIQTHVGVNQFIRETYLPDTWSHRISLLNPLGNTKTCAPENKVLYDIAGPLCFQGDYLQSSVSLPSATPGDVLAIHDTGAYTMSMYSRYNSIRPSVVYGYERINEEEKDQCLRISCFKEKETAEETLGIWGSSNPRLVD